MNVGLRVSSPIITWQNGNYVTNAFEIALMLVTKTLSVVKRLKNWQMHLVSRCYISRPYYLLDILSNGNLAVIEVWTCRTIVICRATYLTFLKRLKLSFSYYKKRLIQDGRAVNEYTGVSPILRESGLSFSFAFHLHTDEDFNAWLAQFIN